MKNKKLDIRLNTKVDLKDFAYAIRNAFIINDDQQENERMASFALSFGENGDITYELILLKKISELINTVYGDVTEEDEDMFNIVQKLKELIPIMNEIKDI